MEDLIICILFYGGIFILIKKYRKNKRRIKIEEYRNQKETEQIRNQNDINVLEIKGYAKKRKILTNCEIEFYKILKNITNKINLTLFTQVSLYELINCNPNNFKAFQKIRYKTIDFVITDENTNILLCIELDDSTHNRPERIKRDNFINEIFKQTNTPLIRIKTQNYYNEDEIKNKIMSNMTLNTAD